MRTLLRVLQPSTANGRRLACTRCLSTSTATENVPARLRFAPSPTGHLHLGGLRTALFNYLLAKKWGGKFLLRIEDTDQTRLVPGSVDALREMLEWTGVDYDEGVGRDGGYGPYTQSERLDLYQQHAKELVEKGHAYECFCGPVDYAAVRKDMRSSGQAPGYDGRCRHLSREDVKHNKQAGKKYVIRFKSQAEKSELPADLVFGTAKPKTVSTGADDFIILKSDGFPTYHLASVVDDHLMEISHVLRGEEWLPSVTKHHQLYRAFEWAPPKFAHLPLLANADKSKLSKRSDDTHVRTYRDRGYEPEALINFVGLLGWDYQTAIEDRLESVGSSLPLHIRSDRNSMFEVFTMPQLINTFDLSRVNHKRAAVDLEKLKFLNKQTLRRKANQLGADGALTEVGKSSGGSIQVVEEGRDALVERYQAALKDLKELEGCDLVNDIEYVGHVFDVDLPRATILKDMAKNSLFFYLDPTYQTQVSEQLLMTLSPSRYVDVVSTVIEHLESTTAELTEDSSWDLLHSVQASLPWVKKKTDVMLPLRHALAGEKTGPTVAQIMTVLGRDRSLTRLTAGKRFVTARARQ